MKSQRRCNSGAEIRGYRGYVLAGARATVPTHETPRTAWRARRTDGREGRWNFDRENSKTVQWDAAPERVFETAVQRPVTGGEGGVKRRTRSRCRRRGVRCAGVCGHTAVTDLITL